MLRLRLFRRDDPGNQIDSRPLDEGELSLGRDAKADWPLDDPDRAISRRHLTVANRGGLLTVRDTSSNGVFLGEPRRRIERDRAVPVSKGEPVHFGAFLLVVEEDEERAAPPAGRAPPPSPFGPLEDREEARPAPAGRAKHPFGSALKPDPLPAAERDVADQDAWERAPDRQAGSWDAGAAARRPEHGTLIGSDRQWAEPPRAPEAEAGYGFDAPFARPILEQPAVPRNAAAIPSDWMEASAAGEQADLSPSLPPSPPPPQPILPSEPAPASAASAAIAPAPPSAAGPAAPRADDQHLFDWFCAGAGLNPAMFAGEAPERVMERLGATYRQAVLGIADLMQARTALRNEYRMVHTSVRPEGNNPFKWVPPQRIAVELLRDEDSGYTTGARALGDALHDIKAHLLCMLAGMRAALATTFDAFSPEQVEARVAGRAYVMKAQRDAALWAEFVAMSERLRGEADDSADGPINRAFRASY